MRWFPVGRRVFTAIALVLLSGASLLVAQEQTVLAPATVIEGEDPETLKMLYESWAKRPKVGKVRGIVMNASGMAMPEATLFFTVDMGVRVEAKANREGRFELEVADTRTIPIYAEALGGAMAGASDGFATQIEGASEIRITLFPTRDLTFKVLSSKGETVAGAHCGAFVGQALVARAKSDEAGKVTLRIPDPYAESSEAARLEGRRLSPLDSNGIVGIYAFSNEQGMGVEAIPLRAGASGDLTELRLNAPQSAKVTVRDRDGKPLTGLPVILTGQPLAVSIGSSPAPGGVGGIGGGFGRTTYLQAPLSADARGIVKSNAEGVAIFPWFSRLQTDVDARIRSQGGPVNPIGVFVLHPDWPRGFGTLATGPDGHRAEVSLFGPGKIRGRLLLPDGTPGAGIQIKSLRGIQPLDDRKLTTNEHGEFELVATVDEGDLYVDDSKWVADRIRVSELVRQSASSELELKLREGRRVTFKVTAGPEYLPVSGHGVSVSGVSVSGGGSYLITTNESGEAHLALDRGLYLVGASSDYQGTAVFVEQRKLLIKDQPKIEVAVHLDVPTMRKISLTVKKSDGKTLAAGAKVELLAGNQPNRQAAVERAALNARAAQVGRGRAIDEREGAPLGRGGFGGPEFGGLPPGAGGFAPAGPGLTRGGSGRAPGITSIPTDAQGVASISALAASEVWVYVAGADGEAAIVKADVLTDAMEVTLAPKVSMKGRLLDEATGEPIVGSTVIATVNSSVVRGDAGPAPRTTAWPNGSEGINLNAVTNAKGEFELTGAVASAPYAIYIDSAIVLPEGAGIAERFGAGGIGGSRRTRFRELIAPKEGAMDLGEIKTKAPPPPPRPRIANDPNAQ